MAKRMALSLLSLLHEKIAFFHFHFDQARGARGNHEVTEEKVEVIAAKVGASRCKEGLPLGKGFDAFTATCRLYM